MNGYLLVMQLNKPFSQACENNAPYILHHLKSWLVHHRHLLEIGSGTGQHACYMAPELPQLQWQTSDLEANHAGISAWISGAQTNNILPPLLLDVCAETWPVVASSVDSIFTANTFHIMSETAVEKFFAGVGALLSNKKESILIVYGPFKYQGNFTSESNKQFDIYLKSCDKNRGIRDFEWINKLANHEGFFCCEDVAMPANNQLLLFKKQ